MDIVAEFGQGDTVGELDVIMNSEHTMTLHAIRDTELARMPLTLFNTISALWVVPCLAQVTNIIRSQQESADNGPVYKCVAPLSQICY